MPLNRLLVRFNATKGISNLNDALRIEASNTNNTQISYLIEGNNIDIDNKGGIHRREGRTLLDNTVPYHSLKSFGDFGIGVKNSLLNKITTLNGVISFFPYPNSPTITDRVSYCKVNNDIYFTDNTVIGYIKEEVCYTLPAVDNGLTGYSQEYIDDILASRVNMPPGHIITYFNGRIYVAQENILYFSDPMAFHRCFLEQNFIMFPEFITMVAPTVDGIWISADKTYFINGGEPAEFQLIEKAQEKVLFGSNQQIPETMVNTYALQMNGKLNIWTSSQGIRIGGQSGQLRFITDTRYSMPIGGFSTSYLKSYNKPLINNLTTLINQYTVIIKS